jgi:histone deacetylase complex regulatory component SIN3
MEEPAAGSDAAKAVTAMQSDFFTLVQSHLANKIDSSVFEDQCRAMLGSQSYVLFTIQKLIAKLLRTMQHIVTVCTLAAVKCPFQLRPASCLELPCCFYCP